jgi:predicted nuclease of predicted toxin-antitoxin system
MKLYLDDNIADHWLVALLRKAGHDVAIPAEVGMAGKSDPLHFVFAMQHSFVLLTRDHDDFDELHQVVLAARGVHPGILAVRFDNDRRRDMSPRGITTAVA